MKQRFINLMREKGIEPTHQDIENLITIAKTEFDDEISDLHELLSKIYESGINLDELEEPIREALGLEPFNSQ